HPGEGHSGSRKDGADRAPRRCVADPGRFGPRARARERRGAPLARRDAVASAPEPERGRRPYRAGEARRRGRNHGGGGRGTAAPERDPMNADVDRFRSALLEERKRVQDAMQYIHDEQPQSGDEMALSTHLMDSAALTLDRELDDTLEENAGNVLAEIDA